VDQRQFSDPDFISSPHQRENVKFVDKHAFIQYFILFRVRFRQVSLFMHVTEEKFEDTNGVIRSCKSKKIKQHNDQKEKGQTDKQRSTKHYTENQ
jgi:hypothetical protein